MYRECNVSHVNCIVNAMFQKCVVNISFYMKMFDGKCHVSYVNCIVNDMFHIDNTYYTEAKLLSKAL
jgi:hypothetical protein